MRIKCFKKRIKKMLVKRFRCKPSTIELSKFEELAIAFINGERTIRGFDPLLACDVLTNTADWSAVVLLRNRTGHQLFRDRIRPALKRDFPSISVGEVLARQQITPEKLVDSWMKSDSHRRAIMFSRYKYIGISRRVSVTGVEAVAAHLAY